MIALNCFLTKIELKNSKKNHHIYNIGYSKDRPINTYFYIYQIIIPKEFKCDFYNAWDEGYKEEKKKFTVNNISLIDKIINFLF
jgi:hypothetical protein